MVTMKDIAKKAGVSLGTVHRVINNKGYFSLDAQKKVQAAIIELKYQPNMFARNLKLSKSFKFGVLIPNTNQDDGFWNLYAEGIKLAESKLNYKNISIKFFYFDRYSFISFSLACDKLLNANLDGIILTPVLRNVSEEFINRIPHDIPYVLIDTHIPQTRCLTSITQNSYVSGRLAGKLMHTILKDDGVIAIIKFVPQSLQINDRIDGIYDYFNDKLNNIKLMTFEASKDDPDKSIANIVKDIVRNKEIKGIVMSNTLTHRAAKAIKDLKLNYRIPVIGFNLIKENIKYLKDGFIEFLINEKPEIQGYKSLNALYQSVVLNETVSGEFNMTIDILTSEHIEYYMNNYLKNFIPT